MLYLTSAFSEQVTSHVVPALECLIIYGHTFWSLRKLQCSENPFRDRQSTFPNSLVWAKGQKTKLNLILKMKDWETLEVCSELK